jgi:hypothetical protein
MEEEARVRAERHESRGIKLTDGKDPDLLNTYEQDQDVVF